MLQLINGTEMKIRLDNLKLLTVFSRKFPKRAEVEVFKMITGEAYVFTLTNYIKLELLGSNFIRNNNIEVVTQIPSGEKIVRMVEGTHHISGKRLIEIIELSSGKIMIASLSKKLIIDTLNSEQILDQILTS